MWLRVVFIVLSRLCPGYNQQPWGKELFHVYIPVVSVCCSNIAFAVKSTCSPSGGCFTLCIVDHDSSDLVSLRMPTCTPLPSWVG